MTQLITKWNLKYETQYEITYAKKRNDLYERTIKKRNENIIKHVKKWKTK